MGFRAGAVVRGPAVIADGSAGRLLSVDGEVEGLLDFFHDDIAARFGGAGHALEDFAKELSVL